MKTKLYLTCLLFSTTFCYTQTTYSETALAKQSEKINHFLTSKKSATPLIFEDILKKLDVKPITFYFEKVSWDSYKINRITLVFHTSKERDYMKKHNIKFHYIILDLKKELNSSDVIDVYLKNKKVWTKDVYNYFKDMPVESVKAN